MEDKFGDTALNGSLNSDPTSEVLYVEDLLLLSRYEEAACASLDLVSRLSEGRDRSDALFQRALATALNAQFFSGRQHEIEAVIERFGVHRLSVPTLVDWALLLLEKGQAPAARQLVERYMGLMMALLPPTAHSADPRVTDPATTVASPQAPPAPAVSPAPRTNLSDTMPAAGIADRPGGPTPGEAERPDPAPGGEGAGGGGGQEQQRGAAAATLEDRAALARLYSQDVLSLGLQQPHEAMLWLRRSTSPQQQQAQAPPLHSAAQPGSGGGSVSGELPAVGKNQTQDQHVGLRQRQGQGSPGRQAEGTSGAGAGSGGGGGGCVVGARELVGSDGTLLLLQRELRQLLVASGMLARASSEESANGYGSNGSNGHGSNGGGGAGQSVSKRGSLDINGLRGALVGGGGGGKASAAPGKPGLAVVNAAVAAVNARREASAAAAAAGTSGAGPHPHRNRTDQPASRPGSTPLLSATPARDPAASLATWIHLPGAPNLTALLRAWLAAAAALIRRLASASRAQLTAAQAWLVCKAAVAANRLRAAAPAPAGLLAQVYGALTAPSHYGRYSNMAAALAVAALAVMAVTAEAPHLRAALQGQWVWLAGLVREAASMGMAMHPSPVATAVMSRMQ